MPTPDPVQLEYPLASIPDAVTTVVSTRIRPDLHRVGVPPLASWRSLGRGFRLGIPLLALYFCMALGEAVFQKPFDWATCVFAGLAIGAPLTFLILVASDRLHRRLSFEVTPFAFRKTASGVLGVEQFVWPRSEVLSIGLNSLTGRLVLHTRGSIALDYFLTVDVAMNQHIVDELRRAFEELPAAALADQQLANVSDGMRPSRGRSVLIGAAVALSIGGAIASALVPSGLCFWFVPAAVVTGLVFGSQRSKKLWV